MTDKQKKFDRVRPGLMQFRFTHPAPPDATDTGFFYRLALGVEALGLEPLPKETVAALQQQAQRIPDTRPTQAKAVTPAPDVPARSRKFRKD